MLPRSRSKLGLKMEVLRRELPPAAVTLPSKHDPPSPPGTGGIIPNSDPQNPVQTTNPLPNELKRELLVQHSLPDRSHCKAKHPTRERERGNGGRGRSMIRMKGSGIRKISRVEEPPRKAVLLNAGEERVERPLGVPAFLKEKKGVRRVDPTSTSGRDTRNRYGCCQGPTSDFMRAPRRVRRVTSLEGADKGSKFKRGGKSPAPPPFSPFRRQSRRFATPGGDRKRRARGLCDARIMRMVIRSQEKKGEARRRSDRRQEITWAWSHQPPPRGPLAHERERSAQGICSSAEVAGEHTPSSCQQKLDRRVNSSNGLWTDGRTDTHDLPLRFKST